MKNEPNDNILYDPETGEPIYPKPEDAPVPNQFDPETGLPMGNNQPTDAAPDLFDPETGLPVGQASSGDAVPDRFDPETGLPLGQSPVNDSVPDRFDPETGLPLGQGASNPDRFDPDTGLPIGSSAAPDRFDPNTGLPIGRGAARAAGAAGRGLLHGKTLAVAGAGIIVLAAGGTAIAGGGHLMKNKKDIVSDALTGIVETMDDGYLEQTFGIKDLQKQAAGGSVTMGITASLDELPMLGIDAPVSGNIQLSRDTKKDAALLSAALKAGSMDLGTGALYIDSKRIAAAAPDLIQPVLTIDYQNHPEKRIESSFMGEQLNIYSEDFKYAADMAGTAHEAVMGKKRYFDFSELYERYKETTKAADTLKNALEIEKIDSKRFTVNGKSQKCKGYHVVLSNKDLADFVKSAGKYIVTDDEIQENEMSRIKDVMTIALMLSGRHYETAEEWADQKMEQLKDAIRSGSDAVEDFFDDNLDDIDMILYVDKKGNAAHLEVNTQVDTGDSYDIEANFNFEGGSVPTRVMDGTISVENGSDRLEVELNKKEKNTKDRWQSQWEIDGDISGQNVRMELQLEHDKKDGDFRIEGNLDGGWMSAALGLEGEILNYSKGKSIELALDEVQIEIPYVLKFKDSVDITMSLTPLSEKVAVPDGKQIDILEADEDDWTDMEHDLKSILYRTQSVPVEALPGKDPSLY